MPKSQFTDDYKKFCTLLVQARKEAKMTQAQVSETLSKPQSYVSKYESGERRLDIIELLEISKAIGFKASDLIQKIE